jgi:hypothetical protein
VVRVLASFDVGVDALWKDLWTPLMIAAERGPLVAVSELLKAGPRWTWLCPTAALRWQSQSRMSMGRSSSFSLLACSTFLL